MKTLTLVLLLTGCGKAEAPIAAVPVAMAPATVVGAPLPATASTPLASVLATPDVYAGKTVVVEGTVRSACQKKGCWMELVPAAAQAGPACRIRFKDYAFFVPTNSAGATAKLSGEVAVRVIPPAEVEHYESEGAKLAKAPDGSARAVEITATGVELRRL